MRTKHSLITTIKHGVGWRKRKHSDQHNDQMNTKNEH